MANPWHTDDMAIVATRLSEYLIQFMLAKGLMTSDELQNLTNQFLANLGNDPGGANARAYAEKVFEGLHRTTFNSRPN